MTATARLPAPALRRPRTVLVGTLFASATSAMVYFGILALYVAQRGETRSLGLDWYPDGVIELGPSGWIFWTLIMSSFTVQWAVQAIRNNDRANAYVALGLTMLFGAAVFNQMWFILNDTGFTLSGSESQFLFFVLNGTFITFLILAMAFIFLTALRAMFGQYSPRQNDGVPAAAMFWHTVAAMYWVTWIAVYVTK